MYDLVQPLYELLYKFKYLKSIMLCNLYNLLLYYQCIYKYTAIHLLGNGCPGRTRLSKNPLFNTWVKIVFRPLRGRFRMDFMSRFDSRAGIQ